MKLEISNHAYAGFKSDDVRYDNVNQVFDPIDFKGAAGEMIRVIFEERGIDVSEVTGRTNMDDVALKFMSTTPFVKHWGFHEEREYRIVAICIRTNKVPDGEQRSAKRIKYRIKNSLLVPFIELFDHLSETFPIKSIIVGPHPLQEKQAEAVEMALESNRLDAKV